MSVSARLNKHIMLFDMCVEGHHASYISYLVEYWDKIDVSNKLFILVTPDFLNLHNQLISNYLNENGRIRFISISSDELDMLKSNKSFFRRSFLELDILCKYTMLLDIDHVLLMFFDYFQIALIFKNKISCSISGIYFRPTLHYRKLFDEKSGFKQAVKNWVKKKLLSFTLQQPNFKNLFSLDQYSIKDLSEISTKTKIHYLPDPVSPYLIKEEEVEEVCNKLQIQPGRHIFLLFGSLGSGKGIYEVLAAIKLLDPRPASQVCLLFIGKLHKVDEYKFKNMMKLVCQTSPVQIIADNNFVEESKIETYFKIADTVLIPYQKHVGMSGILLRAAASRKKVIASDYGLLGKLVRTYNLGITLDASSPEEIMKAINYFLDTKFNQPADLNATESFIAEHSVEKFQSTLYRVLIN